MSWEDLITVPEKVAKATKAANKAAKAARATKAANRATKAAKAAKKGAKGANAARAAKATKAAKVAKKSTKVAKKGLLRRGARKALNLSAKLSPLAFLFGGGGKAGNVANVVGSAMRGATNAAKTIGKITKTGNAIFKSTSNILNGDFSDLESFTSSLTPRIANVGLSLTNTTLSINSTQNELLLGILRTLQNQTENQRAIGQNVGILSSQISQLSEGQGKLSSAIIATAESVNSSLSNVGTAVVGVTEGISDLQETLSPSFVSDSFGGGGGGGALAALADGGNGIIDTIGNVATVAIAGVAAAAVAGYEQFFGNDANTVAGDHYEGDTYEDTTIIEGDEYQNNVPAESGDDTTTPDLDEIESDNEEESNSKKLLNVAAGAIDPIGEMIGENALTRAGGAVGGVLGKGVARLLGGDEIKGEIYGDVLGNIAVNSGLTTAATAALGAVGAAPLVPMLGAAVGGARLGNYLRETDTMAGRGLNRFDQNFMSMFGLSDDQLRRKEDKERKKTQQEFNEKQNAANSEQKRQADELTKDGLSGPITDLIGKWREFIQYPEQNRELIDETGAINEDTSPQEKKYVQGLSMPFQQLVIALAEKPSPQEEKEDDINKLENLVKIAGSRDYSRLLIKRTLNWLKNGYLNNKEPKIKNSGNAIISRLATAIDQTEILDDSIANYAIKSEQPNIQSDILTNDTNEIKNDLKPNQNYSELLNKETATEIVPTNSTINTTIESGLLNNDSNQINAIQQTTSYDDNITADAHKINDMVNNGHNDYNSVLTSIMKSSENSNDSLKALTSILSHLSNNISQFLSAVMRQRDSFELDGGYVT